MRTGPSYPVRPPPPRGPLQTHTLYAWQVGPECWRASDDLTNLARAPLVLAGDARDVMTLVSVTRAKVATRVIVVSECRGCGAIDCSDADCLGGMQAKAS